jgi:tRNA(Ile)-lysidine synthase
MTLPDVVARFMTNFAGKGVVAVSGGPDSVALLRALLEAAEHQPDAQARDSLACASGWCGSGLVIAHLNHQLRGPESDADAAFVTVLHGTLATRARFPLLLRCARVDIAARAREGGESLETTARDCRYQWLLAVAREVGASWIATGHTADDQAETVLHRLLRGTGIKGLAGIPARRVLAPGVELVRPLLGVRHSEVLAYLRQLGQGFREDESNRELTFTRNRIRLDLLPHLAAAYNPEIVPALCRLAAQAEGVQRDMEGRAALLLEKAERPRAGVILVFEVAKLAQEPRFLVCEMFRLVWTREGWPQRELGYEDWQRLAALVDTEEGAVDLAGGIQARRRGHVLQVEWQTARRQAAE